MYIKKLKIGDVELENNLILAPMAGITDLPFRKITKKYGEPGLVCNEMVSSKAICYNDEKAKTKIQFQCKYLEVIQKAWDKQQKKLASFVIF